MREILYKLMIGFVVAWTIADVCQEEHHRAIVYSVCCTLSYAIYLGFHSMLWKEIKAFFKQGKQNENTQHS